MSWRDALYTDDVVGLDLSDGVVAAARVRLGPDGALRLLSAGWAEVAGKASDQELVTAIREVWRSARMPSWTVVASLRSRSGILRYFSYPALKKDELVTALRLEAEESLQLPQDEIALDWHINPRQQASGATSRPYEGLLAAVPRKDVDHQLDVLRSAGLYPIGVDLGAMAVANLYTSLHRDAVARQDTCVLHLTRQRADIAMLFERDGLYARTVYARGASWDESVPLLVEGLQDALKFYVFKLRGQPVRRVVVSGRQPATPDFMKLLKDSVGVPVDSWDPLRQVQADTARVDGLVRASVPPPLAISMGLSLRRYDHD